VELQHLNQKQLAYRWQISQASLERWRCDRKGPAYIKLNGRVVYRLADIEDYENQSLRVCGQPELANSSN
jgi:hypothetical protein